MEPERAPSDDLDVRLQWPAVEHRASDARDDPDDESIDMEPDPVVELAAETESTAIARLAVPDAALGSIAVRLDALTNSTAMLRSLIGERLADYSNQVTRAQSLATRDLEDYRRGHDRTLTEIEASLRESEGAVQHLERSVAATSSKIDEASDRLNGRIERLEDQLEAVGRSLQQVERRLDGISVGQGGGETLARLEETVARLGDAQAEEIARVFEAIEQLPATDRLAALDERVDAIAEFVSRSGQDDELERLADQVASLTRGVETLRKRIALRARQEQGLDQKSVQAIAASIAAQMAAVPQPAPSRSRWRSKRA